MSDYTIRTTALLNQINKLNGSAIDEFSRHRIGRLIERYYAFMRSIARGSSSGLQIHDADVDDIVQTVVLAILQAWKNPDSSLRTVATRESWKRYLVSAIKNALAYRLKDPTLRSIQDESYFDNFLQQIHDDELTEAERIRVLYATEACANRIRAELGEHSDRYELLVAWLISDPNYTHDAIAQAWQMKKGAAATWVSRIRRKLTEWCSSIPADADPKFADEQR